MQGLQDLPLRFKWQGRLFAPLTMLQIPENKRQPNKRELLLTPFQTANFTEIRIQKKCTLA